MPVLVLIAAAAWSGFWFYAASKVDTSVDAWLEREAKAGRIYNCADRSVAGFPFRLEVRCRDASVALVSQTAGQAAQQLPPVTARLGNILVVAQIWDPKLLIAEFTAPASLAEGAQPPTTIVNWTTARSSVAGLPETPQRVALVFDELSLERVARSVRTPLARAKHAEMHGRFAETSTPTAPVIEAALQIGGGSVQDIHPVLATPFDIDVRALFSGLRDYSPKPWPQRFREIQAAGGKIEITQARVVQGSVIGVGAGALSLTSDGYLDGEIQMTVAGLETLAPALGLDKMLDEGVPQTTLDRIAPGVKSRDVVNLFGALDRAVPGLGNVIRQNANVGVAAGLGSLGTPATLDGKKARAFPLRFTSGAVFLGPIKVAQTPPLF